MKNENSWSVVLGTGFDKKKLSPRQKEFNRLTQKIIQFNQDIELLEGTKLHLQQRAAKELLPLLEKLSDHRAEMVRLLDRMQRTYKFTKKEVKTLSKLISNMCTELIEMGYDDLGAIYNHYNPEEDFATENTEMQAELMAQIKSMARQMLNIDFDDDADLDTPEKLKAYIDAQLDQINEKENQAKKNTAQRKPRTEKQQKADVKRAEKEAQKQLEEKKISQSVREVYMDLVKAFHPDREPDEAEKIRKTAILQRVTAAYEANNLLELLHLQLELERIDPTHLDNLADEKLRYFNKNLLKQVKELELTYDFLKMEFLSMGAMPMSMLFNFNPVQIEKNLEAQIKEVKKEIKELKQDLELFHEPRAIKAFLKQYSEYEF